MIKAMFLFILATQPKSLMRIMKLAKYRLKAQVEKDEGISGEGQSDVNVNLTGRIV